MKKYFCMMVAAVFGLAMLGCEGRVVEKEKKTKYNAEEGKTTTEVKEKRVQFDDGTKTETEFKEKTEQYE